MFFWNSLDFLMIQQMLAIWSLVPLPFLNPAWASGSSWFKYSWRLAWRILSRMNFEHIPVSYDEKDILNPRWWNRRMCIFSCENSKIANWSWTTNLRYSPSFHATVAFIYNFPSVWMPFLLICNMCRYMHIHICILKFNSSSVWLLFGHAA